MEIGRGSGRGLPGTWRRGVFISDGDVSRDDAVGDKDGDGIDSVDVLADGVCGAATISMSIGFDLLGTSSSRTITEDDDFEGGAHSGEGEVRFGSLLCSISPLILMTPVVVLLLLLLLLLPATTTGTTGVTGGDGERAVTRLGLAPLSASV